MSEHKRTVYSCDQKIMSWCIIEPEAEVSWNSSGSYRKEGDRLFSRIYLVEQGEVASSLKRVDLGWIWGRSLFTVRVLRHWNRLMPHPWRLSRWGRIRPWATWSNCGSLQGSWTRWPSDVPSNSKGSMILWKSLLWLVTIWNTCPCLLSWSESSHPDDHNVCK